MAGFTAVFSAVGAGVSQVRPEYHARDAELQDAATAARDVRSAALELIQRTLITPGTAGHDLDVLA